MKWDIMINDKQGFSYPYDKIWKEFIFRLSNYPEIESRPITVIEEYITFFKNEVGLGIYKQLFKLLSARGFLLELDNNKLIVSDNSHKLDSEYLCQILDRFLVGYLNNSQIIVKKKPPNIFYLELFTHDDQSRYKTFDPFRYIGYTFWSAFKRRKHGPKIPVNRLDSFIACLVKAISSINVSTFSSCDGHGHHRPYIIFYSRYEALWFLAIFREIVAPNIRLNYDWSFYKKLYDTFSVAYLVSITSKEGYNDILLFYEINMVADFLYKNRIYLRRLKKAMRSQGYGQDIKKGKDTDLYITPKYLEKNTLSKHLLSRGIDQNMIL